MVGLCEFHFQKHQTFALLIAETITLMDVENPVTSWGNPQFLLSHHTWKLFGFGFGYFFISDTSPSPVLGKPSVETTASCPWNSSSRLCKCLIRSSLIIRAWTCYIFQQPSSTDHLNREDVWLWNCEVPLRFHPFRISHLDELIILKLGCRWIHSTMSISPKHLYILYKLNLNRNNEGWYVFDVLRKVPVWIGA